MTMAHTYSVLEISASAYQEIHALLRSANYHHVFHDTKDGEVIDMHGLALQQKEHDKAMDRNTPERSEPDGT